MMRKVIPLLAIVAAATCLWLVYRSHAHRLTVHTYFHNAQGLHRHSKVRANGLDVGIVKDVTLSPRLGEQPVEVVLRLDSRYAPRIPSDSVTMIETEGLLGPPYVEIDVSKAIAAPIGDNGVLKGVDSGGSAVVFQVFLNALNEQTKKMAEESEKLRQAIDSANSRTKK